VAHHRERRLAGEALAPRAGHEMEPDLEHARRRGSR
jgi:hypothetical protein